jgi:Tol biopolymer transport system component
MLRRALLLAAALAALAAVPALATHGYATVCGVELARGVAGAAGGPVCGTDEGDDLWFAGEDAGVRFFGENGHDTVEGSRHADGFQGGGGNDEIHGGRGNDLIDGGDDSDLVFGGLGDDAIVERRFGVRERLFGGPGDDLVTGGRGNDTLYGGPGGDTLLGGTGPDFLWGGPGDDVLYGGEGRDRFQCGPGRDVVYRTRGRAGSDRGILRSAGCERIVTGDPTDAFPLRDLRGGGGADDLVGTGASELLQGKGGADRMFGGGGDDELEGDGATNQGDDLLMGGAGSDRLAGRAGHDRLYGDARSPTAGRPGADELLGSSGRDLLVGGPGPDLLLAAYDGDRVLAGAGNDVVNLLGGDTSDPNARVHVDCGPGRDVVVVNPARRGTFRRCESFAEQFYSADFGHLFRPSPEVLPPAVGVPDAAPSGSASRPAAHRRARAAQAAPPIPAEANGAAGAPSISADGGRVAFSSDAPNLVDGDVNGERADAFVRDLPTATTLLASGTPRGTTGERGGRLGRGPSGALSGDGRFAVLSSNSDDLAGSVRGYAVFRRDLARRHSARACGPGDGDAENPAIGALGFHVAFESRATNLAGSDANQHTDVYWCDLTTGEARRVSVPLADTPDASGNALQPSISADGRYVAFFAEAGGLVPGDGGRAGVYWRDVQSGEARAVDVPAGATTSNGSGQSPRISPDGRYVVFDSDATDLPGGERNGRALDVFRKDVVDGTVTLVSEGAGGEGASGDSTADSISGDGNVVVFTSTAPNLVPGDGNGRSDVFARNLATGATARVSTRGDGGELAGPSFGGAASGDGRYVAFLSRAPDATLGTSPSTRARVYRKDVVGGPLELVSVGLDLPPRSLVAEPFGALARRHARLVAGTVRDEGPVDRVEVSVSQPAGRGRCRFLGRGGRTVVQPCSRPPFLRARLVNDVRWTLRIGRLLPRGRWRVESRAVDSAGQVERLRPGRNVTFVVLR